MGNGNFMTYIGGGFVKILTKSNLRMGAACVSITHRPTVVVAENEYSVELSENWCSLCV